MTAVVVLADGFEEIEAVTPIDLLRRAGVRVIVAGLNARSVVGARGVTFGCDAVLAEVAPDWDVLVLPGGMPGARNLADSPLVHESIRDTVQRGSTVAAICAAPALVLGAHGHLAGRTFTCYPGMEAQATAALSSSEPVVVDGPFVTSRGVGTAAAFSLKLIETLVGAEKATEVARATLLA